MSDILLADAATPFLYLDGALVRRNILRLAEYANRHGIQVRPHTKTHKSRRVARLQIDGGASGLTIAKVGEAEVMREVSSDLLVAYPIVDQARAERVAQLATDCDIKVAIDSEFAAKVLASAARAIGSSIGVLVDLDMGYGRTGVQSSLDSLSLARSIDDRQGLELRGLFCYPGHVSAPPEDQTSQLAASSAQLQEVISLWHQSGLTTEIISGGSTPSAYQSHHIPELTEIRSGTYVFNDMNTVRGGFCSIEDCAGRIVCTVVSDTVPGQVVVDAGSKTLTSDLCGPAPDSGYGYIVEYPQAKIRKLSEEHGQVDIAACDRAPKIGERITIIPNHVCVCVNLQDRVWWLDGGETEPLQPIGVDARGLLS